VTTWIWVAAAVVAIGLYLSWTAGRLDRLHSRIDAARAALAARLAGEEQREVAESELTQALRAVFAETEQVAALREAPGGEEALRDLTAAARRVPMARRFHNDAVRAARAVRQQRIVRYLRLAGHAPFPMAVEMDDEPPLALTPEGAP
jgi:phosphoglycolate phosphatase-like HAD superfamily hydrolase